MIFQPFYSDLLLQSEKRNAWKRLSNSMSPTSDSHLLGKSYHSAIAGKEIEAY